MSIKMLLPLNTSTLILHCSVVSDSTSSEDRRDILNGCVKESTSYSGGRKKDCNNACNNIDSKSKKKKLKSNKGDFSLKSSHSETTQCSSKHHDLSESDQEDFSNANGQSEKAPFQNGFKQEESNDVISTEVDKRKVNYTDALKKGNKNKNKTLSSKMTILTKNKGSKVKGEDGEAVVRKAVSEHSIHKGSIDHPYNICMHLSIYCSSMFSITHHRYK